MPEVIITVTPNAPYKVEGANGTINILQVDGEQILKTPCYLCSCGQSDKKPFCDGSHTKLNENTNGS